MVSASGLAVIVKSKPLWKWAVWKWLPFACLGLWLFTWFVKLADWHHFARLHPATSRPPGRKYLADFALVQHSSAHFYIHWPMKNVVRCVFSAAGIYFYVHWLFRPFHPPFIMPWESVRSVEKMSRRTLPPGSLIGVSRTWYRIYIEDPAGKIQIRLLVSENLGRDLLRYHHLA